MTVSVIASSVTPLPSVHIAQSMMRSVSTGTRWHSMEAVEEDYLPGVVGVAVLGDRVLRLLFSDGTAGDVDFSAERWIGVQAKAHPLLAA